MKQTAMLIFWFVKRVNQMTCVHGMMSPSSQELKHKGRQSRPKIREV